MIKRYCKYQHDTNICGRTANHTCKICFKKFQRNWVKQNPKAVALIARKVTLKKIYGITLDDYRKLEEKQNYHCAICDKKEKTLAVDHDHITGKVRGLLCNNCNNGIGRFKDNAQLLSRAVKYLEVIHA